MPVDRMRMRPWLEQQISSGEIQGLHWVSEGFQKRKASTPRKIKMLKGQREAELKIETTPDSTVLFAEQESSPEPMSSEKDMAIAELPDVCAVVEVATENEEPEVRHTEVSLPLQDSHVSSYSGVMNYLLHVTDIIMVDFVLSYTESDTESDTESTCSDEDLVQLPQDLSIKASQRSSFSSVLRIPPSTSPNIFFTSAKTNFRVTSCREDSPLIAYNTPPWFPCPFNFQNVTDVRPSSPAPKPDLTSSPTSQPSVMAKAVDLSVTKHYNEDT
ncbi:hypothetical protein DPX16_16345 [Anabarilius grahami]|uniref:Interferon regulatory factor 2 n=1 Tax=Anabarilius grahami TaxID=495550 RepID=A0A3N0XLZ0_ANAGA|nr:hypothetical protein DPX16_16345 [Anabarilius grahami]